MKEIGTLSLIELVNKIQKHELSPVELMQAVISRIEETRDGLNAIVTFIDRNFAYGPGILTGQPNGKSEFWIK